MTGDETEFILPCTTNHFLKLLRRVCQYMTDVDVDLGEKPKDDPKYVSIFL